MDKRISRLDDLMTSINSFGSIQNDVNQEANTSKRSAPNKIANRASVANLETLMGLIDSSSFDDNGTHLSTSTTNSRHLPSLTRSIELNRRPNSIRPQTPSTNQRVYKLEALINQLEYTNSSAQTNREKARNRVSAFVPATVNRDSDTGFKIIVSVSTESHGNHLISTSITDKFKEVLRKLNQRISFSCNSVGSNSINRELVVFDSMKACDGTAIDLNWGILDLPKQAMPDRSVKTATRVITDMKVYVIATRS